MIQPLDEREWQTNEDVARRLNEVIGVVNRLLGEGLEVELVVPQPGGSETLQIETVIHGRLRCVPQEASGGQT